MKGILFALATAVLASGPVSTAEAARANRLRSQIPQKKTTPLQLPGVKKHRSTLPESSPADEGVATLSIQSVVKSAAEKDSSAAPAALVEANAAHLQFSLACLTGTTQLSAPTQLHCPVYHALAPPR